MPSAAKRTTSGDFGSAGAKKIDQVMGQRAKGKDIKIIAEYDLFRFL